MLEAPDVFKTIKNRLSNPRPFLWLIEVKIPSTPETMVRITPNPKRIAFGTTTSGQPIYWDPFPVGIGALNEDSEGGLPEFTVSVGGITREIMALLLSYDFLVGQPVKMHLVHEDHLDDPNAVASMEFEVTDVAGDEQAITFTLSTDNLYAWKIPAERIVADFCGFTYKSIECGFFHDPTNTLGSCPRTFAGCEARGAYEIANSLPQQHPFRFGGAPAMLE